MFIKAYNRRPYDVNKEYMFLCNSVNNSDKTGYYKGAYTGSIIKFMKI